MYELLSDFLNGNTTEQTVFRGDDITCTVNNNTFPCLSQWYHGNNSCPLSCAETIKTHLLGEYLCKTKCNVIGTEHSFNTMKAFVAEAPTSPPSSTSGKFYVAIQTRNSLVWWKATIIFCEQTK